MACLLCGSTHEKEFAAEMGIPSILSPDDRASIITEIVAPRGAAIMVHCEDCSYLNVRDGPAALWPGFACGVAAPPRAPGLLLGPFA